MILPNKTIRLSQSVLGMSGELIRLVDGPQTVSLLWEKSKSVKQINSFDKFLLSLDLLFALGLIEYDLSLGGLIRRCDA